MRVAYWALEWPVLGQPTGGVGRYVSRLAEVVGQQVELTVFCMADPVRLEGVRFIELPGSTRLDRYYRAPIAGRKCLDHMDFDIIHSHGDDWVLAANRTPRLRTVYGLSSREAREASGVRQLNLLVQACLEEVAVRTASCRVAIGSDSADHFRAPVIPPVFELHVADGYLPAKEKVAVFIGAFNGRKQGWLALAAAETLRTSGFRFIVFGPPTDEGAYPAWVDFRAGASDSEVLGALAGAEILLAPSTYEGFGIPMWEAMAAGCVVIALTNPGSKFLIAGTEAAILCADGPDFLARAAAYASTRSSYWPATAVRAQARAAAVAQQGSPEHYLRLYRGLAARQHRRLGR